MPTQQAKTMQQNLCRQLFENTRLNAYAILDGAANPGLLERLYDQSPEFDCLYRGELEADIAECAPYLARLEANTAFSEWATLEGFGLHWGIFALAECDLRTLRQHLRKLNMVYDPESNKPLLFRYYDPRVLNSFLPTCDAEQTEAFFGPVQTYFAETGNGFARFYRHEKRIITDFI